MALVEGPERYEAPVVVDLGHLHEFTLSGNKDYGDGDSFTFQNQPTAITS